MCCSSRLDQPGPSRRRISKRSSSWRGPASAASRRSGPCDLEKLFTWIVYGCHVATDASGELAMSPVASSSITSTGRSAITSASSRARRAVIEIPVGLWALDCSTMAVGRTARDAASASGSMPSSSVATPMATAPQDSMRS